MKMERDSRYFIVIKANDNLKQMKERELRASRG
jgi:hypothetical protein